MRVLLLSALLFAGTNAHGYIDPGTGSTIISAIIGLFVAIGIAIKTYWYKLKGLFKTQQDAATLSTSVESGGESDESQAT